MTMSWPGRLHSAGYEALDRIADEMRARSEHKTLDLVFAVRPANGRFAGQLTCRDCDRRWRQYLSLPDFLEWQREHPVAFRQDGESLVDYLTRELIPGMAPALDQPCWEDSSMGKTAEWVTRQLLDAGPRGMMLENLVERSTRGRKAPPDRLLFLLGYMGLMPKGPAVPAVVRLPPEHPMAGWEESLPHPLDGTHLGEGAVRALRGSSWWPV